MTQERHLILGSCLFNYSIHPLFDKNLRLTFISPFFDQQLRLVVSWPSSCDGEIERNFNETKFIKSTKYRRIFDIVFYKRMFNCRQFFSWGVVLYKRLNDWLIFCCRRRPRSKWRASRPSWTPSACGSSTKRVLQLQDNFRMKKIRRRKEEFEFSSTTTVTSLR